MGGRHDARQRCQRHAKAIGEGHHAGHVDAKGLHQRRVLGGRTQISAELGAFNDIPGGDTDDQGSHDHPAAVFGQEHEAQIDTPGKERRHRIRHAGGAEFVAEHTLNDQRQTKGQQQAIQVV